MGVTRAIRSCAATGGECLRSGLHRRGRGLADPYSGTTIRAPRRVDIDHVVPLANAWRSGARRWTEARRRAFANDPCNLLPVSASLNRAKGDEGPEEWLPPRRAYLVTYAIRWIGVKARYRCRSRRPRSGRSGGCSQGSRCRPRQAAIRRRPSPPTGSCDPNYAGACVPVYPPHVDLSDIRAPVRVVGRDPRFLHGDGDGLACQSFGWRPGPSGGRSARVERTSERARMAVATAREVPTLAACPGAPGARLDHPRRPGRRQDAGGQNATKSNE